MYLFRGHEAVTSRALQHRQQHGRLFLTILSYYEIKRGWEYNALSRNTNTRRRAKQKLREFEAFCYQNEVLSLSRDACNHAARIYSSRKRNGLNYQSGMDILIAGVALAQGYTIVTENTQDFTDIAGLTTINWLTL
jgi:tRNA(fMet)-specific endonuclease VapC